MKPTPIINGNTINALKRKVKEGVFVAFDNPPGVQVIAFLNSYSELASEVKMLRKRSSSDDGGIERYQDFIEVYDRFCRKVTTGPAVLDARQGQAMKKIIRYNMKLEHAAEYEDKEAYSLDVFMLVLSKWDNLNDFLQAKVKLDQMWNYWPEILKKLRNAKQGNSKGQSAVAAARARRQAAEK